MVVVWGLFPDPEGQAAAAYVGAMDVVGVVLVVVVVEEVRCWKGVCAFWASLFCEQEKETATCASRQFKHFVSELVQFL